MKTQLRKPARGKASYTKEYKQEALELWRSSGRSAAKVATELCLILQSISPVPDALAHLHPGAP